MQLSCYADECNKLFRFISFFPLLGVFDVYQTQEMGQAGSTVLLLTERGFPQLGTSPITFKRILVFSTYLQSAVQTLINDSVIARGKSWQREG